VVNISFHSKKKVLYVTTVTWWG